MKRKMIIVYKMGNSYVVKTYKKFTYNVADLGDEELKKYSCYGGIDLATVNDIAAYSLCWSVSGNCKRVGCRSFFLHERNEQDTSKNIYKKSINRP